MAFRKQKTVPMINKAILYYPIGENDRERNRERNCVVRNFQRQTRFVWLINDNGTKYINETRICKI